MRYSHKFILSILMLSFFSLQVMANELKGHPSPYLALHGSDPVDWKSWNEKALTQAKQQDKLILVSVGYYACHWCHVMQRESFADEGVAKLLNDNYISIKVDRELNPVLDERLMDFINATVGRGGWPLNVFLTPEGYPLTAMTYVPRDRFIGILKQLETRWDKDRDELSKAAIDMDDSLASQQMQRQALNSEKPIDSLGNRVMSQALQYGDELSGGFGSTTKFPHAPQLLSLLELNGEHKSQRLDEFIKYTLDQMAMGGLNDQVGDGFYRYTVDPQWETPHFEKMLYTNAMLAQVYLAASKHFKEPLYEQIALRTLAFLQDSMSAGNGAYISSLSAVDSENVEGGFYLWHSETLKEILSDDELNFVNKVWDMERTPELEAGLLPRQLLSLDEQKTLLKLDDESLRKLTDSVRSKLKTYREANRKLPRDDKTLAGWNGLVLAALAQGVLVEPELKAQGDTLLAFISEKLWSSKTLSRAVDRDGKSFGDGSLQDYAYVAYGVSEWAKATDNTEALALAKKIVVQSWKRFFGSSGFTETQNSLLPRPLSKQHISDTTLFSAESLLIRASRSVDLEAKVIDAINGHLKQSTKALLASPFYYASLVTTATE